MEKPDFNQDTVNDKIAEIKAMPEDMRKGVSDEVKEDLRGWLLRTFTFTPIYEARMAMWPKSLREETGFGIGTALYYEDWTLNIIVPPVPDTPPERATTHEQSVKGEYNPSTGSYSVSKTHTWRW
jgi:hypothetical protein